MSTATMNTAEASTAPQARVRWRDLAWVAWRQHRLMLAGTSALVLIGAALLVAAGLVEPSRGSRRGPVLDVLLHPGLLALCVTLYAALVGVFWAAPLLSREYEQGTHLLAWSQDVTAPRWLAGKALTLVGAAMVLAIVLGVASQFMVDQLGDLDPSRGTTVRPFNAPYFAGSVLPQLGYAMFGFSLGLAVSALTRRTLLSMGLTLGLFLFTQVVIATAARPHYQTPVRSTSPIDPDAGTHVPDNALRVDSGYLTAAGTPVDTPRTCQNLDPYSGYTDCLRQHGVAGQYSAYQPIDRLATFQLIEFGIFTLLAVLFALVTWRLVRRTTHL